MCKDRIETPLKAGASKAEWDAETLNFKVRIRPK